MNRIFTPILGVLSPSSSSQITQRSSVSRWSLFLSILLLSGLCNLGRAETYGDFIYTATNDVITINNYLGSANNVAIPAEINGKQVTAIAQYAFFRCTNVTTISIPSGVTNIGMSAFYLCTNVMNISVDIQNTAYCSLDGVLFDKSRTRLITCPSLKTGTYVIPNSVTNIAERAFQGCRDLTAIEIPTGVTTIGYEAFHYCTGLTNITIPNGVTYITDALFFGCSSLTSITIPNGVQTIGNYAFAYCTSLSTVNIPNSVSAIWNYAFVQCYSLVEMTMPSRVTWIGIYAFSECTGLARIYFEGNAPTNNYYGLFEFSDNLTVYYRAGTTGWNTTFADRPTVLWTPQPTYGDYEYSLSGATIMITKYIGTGGSITIPDVIEGKQVASIGNSAFGGCIGITSINIPNNITNIGAFAFYGCTGLTNITLPVMISTIDRYAFCRCTGLTNIKIPNSVTSIGESSFYNCVKLTNVVIPNKVNDLGTFAFSGCTSLTSVNIPGSVAQFGFLVFTGCTSLTNATIDEGVQLIGSSAFSGCTSLTTVNIPASVSYIFDGSFSGCTALKSLTIPSGVANIGVQAFANCTNLTSLYFEGNTPVLVRDNIFEGSTNVTVYYRAGTTGWGATYAGRPTALWIQQPTYQEWAQSSGLLKKFPDASAEADDADHDGVSNLREMQAGTDPTDANSKLVFEREPRGGDLADADKTPVSEGQIAFYFQTVPGRQYKIESMTTMGGAWQEQTNVTATTTQKRVLVNKVADQGFYRVSVLP